MGWLGTGRAQAESFLTAVGLARGPGGGSLHWRALQHHLGPPPHPSALGVELVHLLEHKVALEGDRGPPGSACPQGYHPRPGASSSVLPLPCFPSVTPNTPYSHRDTQPRVFTATHIHNAEILPPFTHVHNSHTLRCSPSHLPCHTYSITAPQALAPISHTLHLDTHTHAHTHMLPALPGSATCLTHAGGPEQLFVWWG